MGKSPREEGPSAQVPFLEAPGGRAEAVETGFDRVLDEVRAAAPRPATWPRVMSVCPLGLSHWVIPRGCCIV